MTLEEIELMAELSREQLTKLPNAVKRDEFDAKILDQKLRMKG